MSPTELENPRMESMAQTLTVMVRHDEGKNISLIKIDLIFECQEYITLKAKCNSFFYVA